MGECCKVQTNYVILHYVFLHNRLNCQEMKLLSNPFVIGKYVDKDYFCDREKESEMLQTPYRLAIHALAEGFLKQTQIRPKHWTLKYSI